MSRSFEAWSERARSLARPFSENAFRLLELAPGASPQELARAAAELTARARAGRDLPHMFATGAPTRSAEQLAAAFEDLKDPARAARHALFVPWLRRLTVDGNALPSALEALGQFLLERASPVALVVPLAHKVLPDAGADDAVAEGTGEHVRGGRLFAGDLELAEVLGPPQARRGAKAGPGILAGLGKAPGAVADAVLAATRLGRGRRLHTSYLRTLLAQADSGDPSARRRLPQARALFDEVADEPGGELVLGWRDFLEGKLAAAKKRLTSAARSKDLTARERARAQVLLARIALSRGEEAAWLAAVDAPEADWVRGAVALSLGDVELARRSLDAAWAAKELRPRLAPLLALTLLAQDEAEAAGHILESASESTAAAAALARAWLLHARGDLDAALAGYRALAHDVPCPLGARWGLAVLSGDPAERAASREALADACRGDPALAGELLELALADGALDEVETGLDLLAEDELALPLRVQMLDRLGRREAAWSLRGEREDAVRDRARALLEGGDAHGALRELAGLSLADPLRRRAARLAVLEALAGAPRSDPDAVVARVLGRVDGAELALLDLPAHLYRAVRELENGELARAVTSLRKHLDSGEDATAARLFEVLTAKPGAGWPALSRFVATLLALEQPGPAALVDAAAENDDALWEVAVVAAAVQGGAFEVGEFEGGSEPLQIAAGLLQLRAGLLAGEWAPCQKALEAMKGALSRRSEAVEQAEDALALARFPEAIEHEPEAAVRALELAHDDPAARAHDLAVWRHFLALGAEEALGAAQLSAVFAAWEKARAAGALVHPGAPAEPTAIEDELLANLAALLGTVGPDRAEAARKALEKLDGELAREAMARAGWLTQNARRRKA